MDSNTEADVTGMVIEESLGMSQGLLYVPEGYNLEEHAPSSTGSSARNNMNDLTFGQPSEVLTFLPVTSKDNLEVREKQDCTHNNLLVESSGSHNQLLRSRPYTQASISETFSRRSGGAAQNRCKDDSMRSESSGRSLLSGAVTKAKHVCSVCGKIFKRAHNLKIHGRLHSGDKPYNCPFLTCEKQFRWKSSIVSHINWHRTKKGDVLPGEPGDTSINSILFKAGQGHGKPDKVVGKKSVTENGVEGSSSYAVGRSGRIGESNMRSVEVKREVPFGYMITSRSNRVSPLNVRSMEDVTTMTPSTTVGSYTPPPIVDMPNMELSMFGEELDGRASNTLLPSLSSCKLDGTSDPFESFLEDSQM